MLLRELCVGMGWCGCMKDNRPLHVDDFIPRNGPVTAEQFAEWTILADGCNPSIEKWSKSKSKIAAAFREIMGAESVDVSKLRWSDTKDHSPEITKRTVRPTNIKSFTVLVPDYDEAIAFYVGKLGFLLAEDFWLNNHTKRWVRVSPPGAETGLLLAKAEGPEQKTAIGNQTGGRVGFFLQTDDFARDHTAMQAKGVTFKEKPRHERYGIVAVFSDPWGNLWDLVEPAPNS